MHLSTPLHLLLFLPALVCAIASTSIKQTPVQDPTSTLSSSTSTFHTLLSSSSSTVKTTTPTLLSSPSSSLKTTNPTLTSHSTLTSTTTSPSPTATNGTCLNPGTCGTFTIYPSSLCGPLARCTCALTSSNVGICVQDVLCAGATPCAKQSDCPVGDVCWVQNCCGVSICAPVGTGCSNGTVVARRQGGTGLGVGGIGGSGLGLGLGKRCASAGGCL
ncbi:uncharacterized protein LY89DRAFT_781987 [Mollisia scopiformis]|uniref:Uncharacterized protein n=1 Tax=Mollisia scopiformis TaxID=149040 RepID=A0A194X946_MOLSC|nr:uncharacterized protein LY89DRAFT_781987 [Mollisia scopiformis]KUJ16696.1 hypothetical protein LY89DRAFT_781987 [Mollisia scopiformis]